MSGTYVEDIEIPQGATFQREYEVTVEETGQPFDFTGYTVTGKLKTLAGVSVGDFSVAVSVNKVLIEFPEALSTPLTPTTNFQHRYIVTAKKAGAPDYRIARGLALISEE